MYGLPHLRTNPDLFEYASSVFGGRASRKRLFTFPAFVAEFRALSNEQQDDLWTGLLMTRRGDPTHLVPLAKLDEWFDELCARPYQFNWLAHCWSAETSCPDWHLRHEMAKRLNDVLNFAAGIRVKYWHDPASISNAHPGSPRPCLICPRTSKHPTHTWIAAMRQVILPPLSKPRLLSWFADESVSLVIVHEFMACQGHIPRRHYAARRHVVHPYSLEVLAYDDTSDPSERGKARIRQREYDKPGYQTKRDRSAIADASEALLVERDAMLLNLGGTLKDLATTIRARTPYFRAYNIRPRPESVTAYMRATKMQALLIPEVAARLALEYAALY